MDLLLAGLFLLLHKSLPGASGWMKGLSFGLLAWFFRVLMNAASQWIMFRVSHGDAGLHAARRLGGDADTGSAVRSDAAAGTESTCMTATAAKSRRKACQAFRLRATA